MDQVFTIHTTASRFPSPPAAQEPTGHPTIGMKLLMLRCKQKSGKALGLPTLQSRDTSIGVGGPTPSASLFHMLWQQF